MSPRKGSRLAPDPGRAETGDGSRGTGNSEDSRARMRVTQNPARRIHVADVSAIAVERLDLGHAIRLGEPACGDLVPRQTDMGGDDGTAGSFLPGMKIGTVR